MTTQLIKRTIALENRAKSLNSLLEYAPRAFVMEFAGTPKSGKSTTVEAIRHFLSRHGFRVHVLTERAAVCPIPMKGHLFFNTWCVTSMLAELLANVDAETDIIIIDRGLFDGLVWLTLQKRRGELTIEESRTIEVFLLLNRWRMIIDLAIVMSVSAEEALHRETSQRITDKHGSIMNPEVLEAITDSVNEAIELYGSKFGTIIDYQNTGQLIKESSVELAERVIGCIERFLNPEILVVPKKEVEKLPLNQGGSFGKQVFKSIFSCIDSKGQFIHRAEAESHPDFVQIIPAGLLAFKSKVFLFLRKETDPKYRLYGKTTIWQGCHVSKQKFNKNSEHLKKSLWKRISRSLFLSRVFNIDMLGYCWDQENPKSSRHFGIIYRIDIDNPHTAVDLKKKEFRKQRGHGLIGEFVDLHQLNSDQDKLGLESWSKTILNYMMEI